VPHTTLLADGPDAGQPTPIADLIVRTLQTVGGSANTNRAYRTAISLFLQFLDDEHGSRLPAVLDEAWRPFAACERQAVVSSKRIVWRTVWTYRPPIAVLALVDGRSVEGYRLWRARQGDSANAVNARAYAVQTFLRIALAVGALTAQQGADLGLKPYKPRREPHQQQPGRRLTGEEVRRLRSMPVAASSKGRRDLAVLDTMLFAGLDAHEVAALRLTDLCFENGRWRLMVSGRGQHRRSIPVHDTLEASLQLWLDAAGLTAGNTGALFRSVNKSGQVRSNGITASVVLRLVAEYGQEAAIPLGPGPRRLTARDLRRTCARNAYDNGAGVMLVQTMLGHSDPKTTVRYIGVSETEFESAVDYVKY